MADIQITVRWIRLEFGERYGELFILMVASCSHTIDFKSLFSFLELFLTWNAIFSTSVDGYDRYHA